MSNLKKDEQLPVCMDWLKSNGFKNQIVNGQEDDVFYLTGLFEGSSVGWGRYSKRVYIRDRYGRELHVLTNPSQLQIEALCELLGKTL